MDGRMIDSQRITGEHEGGEHGRTGVLGCRFCLSRLNAHLDDSTIRLDKIAQVIQRVNEGEGGCSECGSIDDHDEDCPYGLIYEALKPTRRPTADQEGS